MSEDFDLKSNEVQKIGNKGILQSVNIIVYPELKIIVTGWAGYLNESGEFIRTETKGIVLINQKEIRSEDNTLIQAATTEATDFIQLLNNSSNIETTIKQFIKSRIGI